jgi:hypothetical protein
MARQEVFTETPARSSRAESGCIASHRVCDASMSTHWANGSRNTLGGYQRILPIDPSHELLQRPGVSVLLEFFPEHPHEGSVAVPADDPSARVVAWGTSRTTGRRINLVIAFEHSVDASEKRLGRGIAESSFHHFADYHWDTSRGAPSFVTEPEGDGMKAEPRAQEDISRYVRNIASWRAPVTCRRGGLGTHVSIEALPTSCTRWPSFSVRSFEPSRSPSTFVRSLRDPHCNSGGEDRQGCCQTRSRSS